jgi:hypothetical protein
MEATSATVQHFLVDRWSWPKQDPALLRRLDPARLITLSIEFPDVLDEVIDFLRTSNTFPLLECVGIPQISTVDQFHQSIATLMKIDAPHLRCIDLDLNTPFQGGVPREAFGKKARVVTKLLRRFRGTIFVLKFRKRVQSSWLRALAEIFDVPWPHFKLEHWVTVATEFETATKGFKIGSLRFHDSCLFDFLLSSTLVIDETTLSMTDLNFDELDAFDHLCRPTFNSIQDIVFQLYSLHEAIECQIRSKSRFTRAWTEWLRRRVNSFLEKAEVDPTRCPDLSLAAAFIWLDIIHVEIKTQTGSELQSRIQAENSVAQHLQEYKHLISYLEKGRESLYSLLRAAKWSTRAPYTAVRLVLQHQPEDWIEKYLPLNQVFEDLRKPAWAFVGRNAPSLEALLSIPHYDALQIAPKIPSLLQFILQDTGTPAAAGKMGSIVRCLDLLRAKLRSAGTVVTSASIHYWDVQVALRTPMLATVLGRIFSDWTWCIATAAELNFVLSDVAILRTVRQVVEAFHQEREIGGEELQAALLHLSESLWTYAIQNIASVKKLESVIDTIILPVLPGIPPLIQSPPTGLIPTGDREKSIKRLLRKYTESNQCLAM